MKGRNNRRSAALIKAEASVLMLFCRRAIYGVLGAALGCCIAESVVFVALNKAASAPELVFAEGHVALIGALGFLAVCAVLAFCGSGTSKQDYTLNRLLVSPRRILVLGAIANALMLLIFWAMQTLTLVSLCQEFTVLNPELSSGNTLFLAFYRDSFLHGCLPMADVGRWARNIVMLGGLALCLSCFSTRKRRGQWGVAAIFLSLVTVFSFSTEMGSTGMDVALILLALCVSGGALYGMWGGDDEDEENHPA